MRRTEELLDLPYSFAQLRPCMPREFEREAGERGVQFPDGALEALHRARILVPLYRVIRNNRAIASRMPASHEFDVLARRYPTDRYTLVRSRECGWLRDPAGERFISRRSRRRVVGLEVYEASVYLYSPHQRIALELVKNVLHAIEYRGSGATREATVAAPRDGIREWRRHGERFRELAIALSALEPLYYPEAAQRISLSHEHDAGEFFEWRRTVPTGSTLAWLGVDAEWMREAGRGLLSLADRVDPLRDWLDLIAHVRPDMLAKLRGTARNALDMRIAAEVFLRYHDDLVRVSRGRPMSRRAVALEEDGDGRRIKRRRPLDGILMQYGLSPHPRLVLVLEGETERLLFSRVMRHFEVRTDDDFISVEIARGVDRDLSSLVAYAATPRTAPGRSSNTLKVLRPPTRVLVVFDPEGSVATAEARERKRASWIDRILLSMPAEARQTQSRSHVRDQVDRLVELQTWNATGESFEFAHFTDRQLAIAIDGLDVRSDKPALEAVVGRVASIRRSRGNLASVLHRTSKVALADALWPVLERRLTRATTARTEGRIPVVRMLDLAIALAHEFPRRDLVIGLDSE